MDDAARDIHRLLSDGRLSGPESDELLQRVFERLAQDERRRSLRAIRVWSGAALAAAAAVLLVVYVPRDPGHERHENEEGAFTPNALRVACSPGELTACPVSSALVFSLSGASGFLSAYAEPIEDDGTRVFFFTKEDGSIELPAPDNAPHPSERAVQLAGTLEPGRYHVIAVVAERALGREELVRGASARMGSVEVRAEVRAELVVTQ